MRCVCVALSMLAATGVLGAATAWSQADPAFEVASIRRNMSKGPAAEVNSVMNFIPPGDTVLAMNVSLETLIPRVYAIRVEQLLESPAWFKTDRFDIVARTTSEASPEQRLQMMQRLLEERFGLVLEKGRREADVYELVVARADRRLGPDLRPAPSDCAVRGTGGIGAMALKTSSGARPTVAGTCSTIASLASGSLQRTLKTTVIDRTGLPGMWDFTLVHSGVQPVSSGEAAAGAARAPSLFTAVEEQLGLRLVRQKSFVDVVIVKAAHQPTEN